MPGKTLAQRNSVREIKKTHHSLKLKESWFSCVYTSKEGIKIQSESVKAPKLLSDTFKSKKVEVVPYKNSDVAYVFAVPVDKKAIPVAYYKDTALYAPFIICAMAESKEFEHADELPINTLISAIDEVFFSKEAIVKCEVIA